MKKLLKIKMRVKYNLDLLKQIVERDNCEIDINLYEKIKLNREIKIKFICSCSKLHSKTFRYINENGGAFCIECTKTKSQEKMKETCLKKFGVENPGQSKEVREKMKATNLERLGVEHPAQSNEVKEKMKSTMLERYGVEYSLQSEEIRNKIKTTNFQRYGFEYSSQSNEIQEKFKATNLERLGVEYPGQSNAVKEKMKSTNLEKFGFEYPFQNSEFYEKISKNLYKIKLFTFPCNNIVKCQGYEPFAFNKLIKDGYTYQDIINKKTEVPEIWYIKDDNKHRYYCDIFIPKENKIIEVKSTWTYEKDIEDIPLKGEACIENGYKFEVWIFDAKENLKIYVF
jgi:hypothetical protein